jgi:hypothetical protein
LSVLMSSVTHEARLAERLRRDRYEPRPCDQL